MGKTDSEANVLEEILRLHEQAITAIDSYNDIQSRVRLYEKYLDLRQKYNVQMKGRLLLVEGGLSRKPNASSGA